MKTQLGIASLLLVRVVLAPLSLPAQQPTALYVNRTDPTCAGHSPCFTTIQAAINAAGPGSAIRIQAGTYPEQLSIAGKNNFPSATEIDRIVIEADPSAEPGQVIVRGAPGACTGNYAIRLQQSKFITIRGLTITGTGGQAISLLGGNNQNQDIHIELNRIFGNGSGSCDGGITVARGNPGTLIVNNLLYANGRNALTFIDADGGPHYVINNTIWGNQWNGIDVARNHTITLANNIVNNNGTASGITGGRFGVRRESATTPQPAGIKLLSNVVCGNVQGQISAQVLDSTDSSNFTPLGNEGPGVGALPGCEFPANLFGNVNGADSQPNTADDDFSLKANSLAIDVGMDPRTLGFNPSYNPIFEADFVIEGIRPADGNADRAPAFDAGAFEFPNAPPVANAGANQTVPVSQLVTLNGTQSSDLEGASLSFQWTVVTQPAGSSISLNGSNTTTATFTPLIAGRYIFQLVVNDGQFASPPSTVVITAVNANQAPTANTTSVSTNEDSPVAIVLSGGDPDSSSLNFGILGGPAHGTLGTISAPNCVANGPGSSCIAAVTYTPAANYSGSDSFTFKVNDGSLDSNVASASVTIDAVNDPPVANNTAVTTDEDIPVNIRLSASDVDNTNLTLTIVNAPSNGSLAAIMSPTCMSRAAGADCTATVTYTPRRDFNGTDSFTFKAGDGTADSNGATVSITVNAVNDPPVAQGQSLTTAEDSPIVITLAASDVDTASLEFALITPSIRGGLGSISTSSCVSNGAGANCTATVTYTPGANVSGPDNFTFKVRDGYLDSNVAMVSITVNSVNDAAVAGNDFYSTLKNTPLKIFAPGVLANDNDADGARSDLTAVLVSGPTNASEFILNADGSFSYTPALNFTGTDTFTYTANDGSDDGNETIVSIAVVAMGNAPLAANDFYHTLENTGLNVASRGVLANDNADTSSANITAILVAGPSRASTFTLNPDGSFEYIPETNFRGVDSFTYKANASAADSNVAMVTIAVMAANEFPVAINDTEGTNEDAAKTTAAPGVLGNDNLELLTSPTAILVSGPTRALSFALNPDGSFNYTPQNDYYGADNFAYRIFDGTKYSNVAMVNIEVVPVNDIPIAQNQSITTNENTPATITLMASDIDNRSLIYSVATPPSHGALGNISAPNCMANGDGANCTATVTYTPAANYFGPDTFTFTVTDGLATSPSATVSIAVLHINRSPAANAGGPYTGNVGMPVQFSGSGNDPDGDAITFSWDFGDGSSGTGSSPMHIYSAPGIYPVTLAVTDPLNASGGAQTTATISAGVILNPIGNKTVNLGETLTFTVGAINTAGGPANLYVAPLPLMTNATFNASTGVFTFRPSTTQVGTYQLTFTATSGSNSASETITITVPNPSPGGTTSVRGRIVNLAQTALANVTVTLKSSGHTALSGTDGFFTISGVPSGTQQLLVNGRQSNLGVYAILAVAVELIDGVVNDLNSPISLPDVDIEAEVQVSPTFNTVVTNPNLPGVEVEIIGGSATNPDGTPFTGKLSINPVPDYGRPESRPEELRPGMAVTIQPAGIRFNPPARITFPNADAMAPGNELNLWSLSPDTGKFNIVGKMAVSGDGQTFITVEGGVVASAWHFPLATATTSNPSQGNSHCGSCRTPVGSEANLEEGSLFITHSLASYHSLSQSRGLSLTYSSLSADPRPIISLDSTLSLRAAVPNTFSTRLKVGGVQQGEEIFTNSSSLPEDSDSTSRISVQFDASNLATGRYPFEATVFSNYLNSSVGGITTGNVIVVNRKNSTLGAGWAITDLQQLHLESAGGVLLTSGDGTALFFSGGPDTFTSPARDFSILARNSDGTYTRTFKDGTKINFDARGFQSSVIDRNTNTTSFTYDGNGRLIAVTDPAGLVTMLAYGGVRLQTIIDPTGRQTQFQFDAAGNLTRITNPDSSVVTYAHDGKGHIIQATNARGLSTNYTYDFGGRFSQSTRPGGETRALSSSKIQGLVDTASGQGTATNPAPVVPSSNAIVFLTDGRGNLTRFTLDSLGQVISQTDTLGQTTTTLRDANGLPTRITRPNGAVTTMTYDAKSNLLTSTDPVGAMTTFTYEPTFNQVKTIRDAKGNVTTINYDANGNPTEIIDALMNRTQMTYDSRGLLLSVTSAVGTPVQATTTFTYDLRGNLLTTTNPKGDVTTLAYDAAGNVSHSTDAENRVTQFTYDPANRLITVLDADLKTTQYGYDPKGNLTELRDAKNQLTTFTYDGLDRLTSATNPLGLTETFAYDGNGNLISTTNRNGQTITFDYDALNRLTNKTRPPTSTESGNQATIFSYDSVGNLTKVNNSIINVLNQYDAANRLISSASTSESALAGTIVPINADTTITAANSQFDGKTLQINGRTLTVDGSHTFANLLLINGAVLRHSPTTANTLGKLDITVTGTIQIDLTSRIDVSGLGFLAAGRPGNLTSRGMTLGFQPGSFDLSGGSYGGLGGSGGSSVANAVYGDFRNPNEPGSGGGAVGVPGGNGGGLIRIVAQTLALSGAIRANGGLVDTGGSASGGSGGGIRIDVGTISGGGSITASGSPGGGTSGGGGSGGRIAVYYQNATGFNFANVSASGVAGPNATNAGAGTVFLQGPSRETGELIADNNNLAAPSLSTPILGASTSTLTLSTFRVRRGARAKLDSTLNLLGTLEITGAEFAAGNRIIADITTLTSNAVLTHLATTATTTFKMDLSTRMLSVDATSRIDATGLGFLAAGRPGNLMSRGITLGFQPGSFDLSGGSYGGLGGSGGSSVANAVYGDFRNPNEPGSGGGAVGVPGGNGGGLIRIVAQTLALSGAIRANGGLVDTGGSASGGSGGGIRIDVGTISGSGSISANGTPGGATTGGGGGGGRIAVYYQNATGFNFANVSASGVAGPNATNAGAGTVFLQGPSRETGELIADNNNLAAPPLSTPILGASTSTLTLSNFRVRRGARAKLDSTLNLAGTLEITGAEFAAGNRILADTATLNTNAVLTQFATTGTTTFKVDLHTESLTIDSTSRVDVTGLGFLGQARTGNPFPNNGMTLGFHQGSASGAGGSYGGLGGGASPNPVYGVASDPNEPGSGGGAFTVPAGNGGGLIRIAATTLILNGTIRANGGPTDPGGSASGGSGGGIRIDAGAISGSGTVTANGSQGTLVGGGGGGGRVALNYQTNAGFNLSSLSAVGGSGSPAGQNGTVTIQQQIAMLVPEVQESSSESGQRAFENRVRFALSDQQLTEPEGSARRRAFESPIVDSPLSTNNSPENLYLAMVAEGKLKPFAATITTSQGTGVSADDLDPIYTYDLNGNRTSMIDPTGLTTYQYDTLNRLTSMTNNKGQTTSFAYDALGRRTSMTHANGVVTSYTYDSASQLLSLGHQLGATTINSFSYSYDKVGNRKTKTSRDGLHDYAYDVLNRLTQAANPLPSNPLETFNYDPVGNRTNSNQNGASVFNSANELLDDASFTYQYDNNGNMTRKTAKIGGAITAYEYDAENKLVRVVSPANTVNYRYDGLGRRVEREIIAGTTTLTKYVYDNEDILLELNGSNAIVARYTHGPGVDEPLVMDKNSQSFYYHADGLGSITDLTNQTGTVVQRYTYSSFGKIESQLDPNFVQPYTFTGRELDTETELYYYRTRYYDYTTGRFVQTDPIRDGTNFYGYVDNNPARFTDSFGLAPIDIAANIVAGFGDSVSFGLTRHARGNDAVVDECSLSYRLGSWAGFFHGLAMGGASLLNGGAKTILWSGTGAREAAEAARNGGKLLTDTPLGRLLDVIEEVYKLPKPIWSGASRVFASNAQGEVRAFLKEPSANGIYNTVERPTIDLINKIHEAVTGSPATVVRRW